MAVEVGQIAQGTVVRLLNYGVLVKLDDGTTGLVHISEIDQNYVRDVNDYFQVGDAVMVKILATGERGKVELSVKQARGEGDPIKMRVPTENGTAPEAEARDHEPRRDSGRDSGRDGGRDMGRDGDGAPAGRRESRASFEDKMNEFMRSSSERLSDLKRNIENKRGGKKTR